MAARRSSLGGAGSEVVDGSDGATLLAAIADGADLVAATDEEVIFLVRMRPGVADAFCAWGAHDDREPEPVEDDARTLPRHVPEPVGYTLAPQWEMLGRAGYRLPANASPPFVDALRSEPEGLAQAVADGGLQENGDSALLQVA